MPFAGNNLLSFMLTFTKLSIAKRWILKRPADISKNNKFNRNRSSSRAVENSFEIMYVLYIFLQFCRGYPKPKLIQERKDRHRQREQKDDVLVD